MAFPNVLTIGGIDNTGQTGVLADIRTFAALKCHGVAAVTLVSAQTTEEVRDVHFLPPALIDAQIRAAFDDLGPLSVKVGALGTAEIIAQVAATLREVCTRPVVVDPFAVSKGGEVLLDEAALDALKTELFPIASVITPNLAEAALLTGTDRAATQGDVIEQGKALVAMGVKHALVTGGQGKAELATDILVSADRPEIHLRGPREATDNVRGASDTLSAAIAGHIAHDMIPYEAMQFAKLFISGAIGGADKLTVGAGPGPVNQMYRLWEPRDAAPPESG